MSLLPCRRKNSTEAQLCWSMGKISEATEVLFTLLKLQKASLEGNGCAIRGRHPWPKLSSWLRSDVMPSLHHRQAAHADVRHKGNAQDKLISYRIGPSMDFAARQRFYCALDDCRALEDSNSESSVESLALPKVAKLSAFRPPRSLETILRDVFAEGLANVAWAAARLFLQGMPATTWIALNLYPHSGRSALHRQLTLSYLQAARDLENYNLI